MRALRACVAAVFLVAGCASRTTDPPAGDSMLVSPAELLASLATVANGRNPDLVETGLVLKRIELKLLVGRERQAGARASFVILDAEASRRSEVSFSETFTLELPPPERRRSAGAIPPVSVPGVAEFVDSAMAAAREIAAAAAREGLPQRLREVDLTARIVRSGRIEAGLGFESLARPSVSAGIAQISDQANTVRLVFGPP